MDKCFCHFNGYEVKDAKARKSIEEINEVIENFGSDAGNILEDNNIYFLKLGTALPNGNKTSETITYQEYLDKATEVIGKMKEKIQNNSKHFTVIANISNGRMIFSYYGIIGTSGSIKLDSFEIYAMGGFKQYTLTIKYDSEYKVTSMVLAQIPNLEVLTTAYNKSYTPYYDYTPAPKKYVDDSIASAIEGITPGEGGSITIDSTPTAGSTNAVSSGGVVTYIDNSLNEFAGGIGLNANEIQKLQRVLLWKNESGEETFGADALGETTTITCLDTLSNYTGIEIIYDTNQGVKSSGKIPLIKTSRYGLTSICMDAIRQGVVEGRQAYINDLSTTDIIFTNGFKFETYGTDTKTLEKRACVPLFIYGYKDVVLNTVVSGGEE